MLSRRNIGGRFLAEGGYEVAPPLKWQAAYEPDRRKENQK